MHSVVDSTSTDATECQVGAFLWDLAVGSLALGSAVGLALGLAVCLLAGVLLALRLTVNLTVDLDDALEGG